MNIHLGPSQIEGWLDGADGQDHRAEKEQQEETAAHILIVRSEVAGCLEKSGKVGRRMRNQDVSCRLRPKFAAATRKEYELGGQRFFDFAAAKRYNSVTLEINSFDLKD
jgi:hypothetical protein